MRALMLLVFPPTLIACSMLSGCKSSPAATPSEANAVLPAEPVRNIKATGEAHIEIAGLRLDGAWLDDLYGHSTGTDLAVETTRSEKSIEIRVGDANQQD